MLFLFWIFICIVPKRARRVPFVNGMSRVGVAEVYKIVATSIQRYVLSSSVGGGL